MDLALNVLILILAFITAVLGVGGDTWIDNLGRWYEKITKRGWVALASLVTALILGVVIEVRNARAQSALEAELENEALLQNQLATDLQEAKDELKSARTQLELNGSILDILENASKEIKSDSARSRELLCQADANGLFGSCEFHVPSKK